MTQITAPWTPEQVAALNQWQQTPVAHPFTCGRDRMDNAHKAYQAAHSDQDFGQLVATENGWVCPACNYRQGWAHDFMFGDAHGLDMPS